MVEAQSRPAHRPSRKSALVDAAISLFSTRPVDQVTAADIAREAGMTSAALYYHFGSKDDLLVESIRSFGDDLLSTIDRQRLAHRRRDDGLVSAVRELVRWLRVERPALARLYFVTSSGLNLQVESVRREQLAEMVVALRKLVRGQVKDISAVEAGVVAAAVMSLLEVAAAREFDAGVDDVVEAAGWLTTKIADVG